MENPRRNRSIRGFEENIMAIIDSSGVKESRDLHDDRLSFLEAVRAACLVPEPPSAPSWKIYAAAFRILRDSKTLELAMASYQLLTDLDKRYPRVSPVDPDKTGSPSAGVHGVVVVKEAWSPFLVGSETSHGGGEGNSDDLIDSARFLNLIEGISQSVNKMETQLVIKPVEDMLLFRYLVNAIEADFFPRKTLCRETLSWVRFSECILNMLLGSRKLNFKNLVKGCMSIMYKRCHHHTGLQDLKNGVNTSAKIAQDSDVALAIAITELEKGTCIAVQKLLTLIMELDVIRKEADHPGLTPRLSRTPGLIYRTPILDIILDELTYNKDHISPFLMVFSEPRWKLEIILQYFSKYCPKPSVRTRRSNESLDNATLKDVLTYFSTPASTKTIARKITSEVAQLLLVHAFQAYLSVQCDVKLVNFTEKIGGITLIQICSGLLSAFQNLRENDETLEVTTFEKEALFTAATILRQKS